jgi:ubiquinone/menaquinone biosynthesis C-methylase UbiE
MPTRYDRLAYRYDSSLSYLERRYLQKLRKEVIAALPNQGRILELGAGTGANFVFYDSASRVVATEPSREMIRFATNKSQPNIILLQSYGERLPFRNGTFAAAVATLVMCSVQSPEQVFAELKRVVRPGGVISLLEHVRPNGVLGIVFDALNLFTVPLLEDHVNRRTVDSARSVGLEVTKVHKVAWGIVNIITCKV